MTGSAKLALTRLELMPPQSICVACKVWRMARASLRPSPIQGSRALVRAILVLTVPSVMSTSLCLSPHRHVASSVIAAYRTRWKVDTRTTLQLDALDGCVDGNMALAFLAEIGSLSLSACAIQIDH